MSAGRKTGRGVVRFGEKGAPVRVLMARVPATGKRPKSAQMTFTRRGAKTNKYRFRLFHHGARKMLTERFSTPAAAREFGALLLREISRIPQGSLEASFSRLSELAK